MTNLYVRKSTAAWAACMLALAGVALGCEVAREYYVPLIAAAEKIKIREAPPALTLEQEKNCFERLRACVREKRMIHK